MTARILLIPGNRAVIDRAYSSRLVAAVAILAMKFCETTLVIGLAAFNGVPLRRCNPNVTTRAPDRPGRIICYFRTGSQVLHDGNGPLHKTYIA